MLGFRPLASAPLASGPLGEAAEPAAAPVGLRHYPAGRRITRAQLERELAERPRAFTRKYFNELIAAKRAQEALERKAAASTKARQKAALEEAASLAADAIAEAAEQQFESQQHLAALTRTLQSAASARSAARVLEAVASLELAANLQRAAIIADEEDAAVLMLLS